MIEQLLHRPNAVHVPPRRGACAGNRLLVRGSDFGFLVRSSEF